MKRTRLIVDVSSVIWTCLLAGEDNEFGIKVDFNGKPTQVNSAAYGYENVINHLVKVLETTNLVPRDMVLVVEGQSSKLLRTTIFDGYKGGTTGESRPKEAYVEFGKCRDMLVEAFLNLGAMAVKQNGLESDDVIAYLAHHLDGIKIIDSNDGDIAALISDEYGNSTTDVMMWKPSRGGILKENPYGPFPCRLIGVYKALMGDGSDKLPGAKGFGPKAWLDLLVNFGVDGLEVFRELLETKQLDKLKENVAEFKPLQKVLDNKEMVYKSYMCAKMYAEKVNTVRMPLEITAGMVRPRSECKDERLAQWAQNTLLVTADNFDTAFKRMRDRYDESPILSFDIETSSCDEGDEWLERVKKAADSEGGSGVDVFGARLCSFSVTFGKNMQYTCYFTVEHVEEPGVKNITREQAKQVIESFPADKRNAIQNVAFELPVIMEDLGPLGEPVKP